MQRFVFAIGVSKFSHVSIFSDLNNLTDITMNGEYAMMFGSTQQEFETYFAARIERVAISLCMSQAELLAKIRQWYNGYRFHVNRESVYNPVSLALFFRNGGEFNNYRFAMGTPPS